jgi:hypothetical protein
MPITSIEQRQIELPHHIQNMDGDKWDAAADYLSHLMAAIHEPMWFYVGAERYPRVRLETVGRKYMTINYIRAEDESLIVRLFAAAKSQMELL